MPHATTQITDAVTLAWVRLKHDLALPVRVLLFLARLVALLAWVSAPGCSLGRDQPPPAAPGSTWARQTNRRPAEPPPVSAAARAPRDYTAAALAAALKANLRPEEVSLVVNPVAATSEMRLWAHELTASVTNGLQRAKALYDLMTARVATKPVPGRQYRTAQEVFAAWDTPGEAFLCQELTYLYVALARAVCLRAYTVFVEQDCYGAWNYHACAAVFIAGRAFLVDPAYSRFGVPHKRFIVLDDLQAAGLYLSGMVDRAAACQAACKLAPSLAVVQASLFDELAGERRWIEAGERLRLMRRLEPHGPMTYYAEAVMAFHEGKDARAERFLAKAIHLAPRMPQLHAMLGYLNAARGRLVEAKRCYENAYNCCQDERSARMTQQAIADIEARLNRGAEDR